MKMTPFQAREFVKAWKANAAWQSVAHVFEGEKFFPYEISVRVLIGQGNILANNALWEKREKAALIALCKFGFEHGSHYTRDLHQGATNKADGFCAADFRKKTPARQHRAGAKLPLKEEKRQRRITPLRAGAR
jgi:hypothetical protein